MGTEKYSMPWELDDEDFILEAVNDAWKMLEEEAISGSPTLETTDNKALQEDDTGSSRLKGSKNKGKTKSLTTSLNPGSDPAAGLPRKKDEIGVEDREGEDNWEEEEEGKVGNARLPLPEWLMSSFNTTIAEQEKWVDGLPPLYQEGMFWLPQPSPCFLLQDSNCRPHDLFKTQAQFFFWDPFPLCQPEGIPCPNCKIPLSRHSTIKGPRRVIDINRTFWLIGYRYHCRSCQNTDIQKRPVIFCSWDKRLLAMLPPDLAPEFPAELGPKGGISKTGLGWVRSFFQSGLDATQIAHIFHTQHLKKYDTLHLQYLSAMATHREVARPAVQEAFQPFPPFEDTSRNGFHGFIPTAQWFSEMYDRLIRERRPELR